MELLNIMLMPLAYIIAIIICIGWALIRDHQDRNPGLPICFAFGFFTLLIMEVIGLILNNDVVWEIVTYPYFWLILMGVVLFVVMVVDIVVGIVQRRR